MWIPILLVVTLGSFLSAGGAVALLPLPVGGDEAPEAPGTGSRPYDVQVPDGLDESEPAPLVVLLHGYGSTGANHREYFRLGPVADREGFLLATPDGTLNPTGSRFWNATDACCDFFDSGVDDVSYLDAMIDEISVDHDVDPERVYLVGHSNGGFMSHRFACDRSERVAAIVSLAGQQWSDPERCQPSSDVSVLQVHGTDDGLVAYEGGSTPGGSYPGAEETVATWAAKNGCEGALEPTGTDIDIETALAGPETSVSRYSGCGESTVELWTINDGAHSPTFNDRWADAIWEFMEAHPKG